MSANAKNVSLVIPALNEEEVILNCLDQAVLALEKEADHFEIIVVDDGSSDSTAKRVSEYALKEPRVRVISGDKNRGYGHALRTGFEAARHEMVGFTDADCQFNLLELGRLIYLVKSYDLVCGYRIERKDPLLRRLVSKSFNWTAKTLLPIEVRDIDCAFKLMRKNVVNRIMPQTDGFLFNAELLAEAKLQNYSIVEVGVTHHPRIDGQSKVSFRQIPIVLLELLRYWWHRVLFPESSTRSNHSVAKQGSETGIRSYATTLLILLAALILFTNLGYPLIDRDETRYAEIPREMVVDGNFLVPQLNFKPYFDKPPLTYWLGATSYLMFGIQEWSIRMVPAICSFLTICLTVFFSSRWYGRNVGFYSGLVLLLSLGFAVTSRMILIDNLLTLLITLSLFSLLEAIRSPELKTGWWLFSSLICGLAFLTKGPLCFVLIIPPAFGFALLSSNGAKPGLKHWMGYVFIAILFAAPWFVMMSARRPDFLYEFFYHQNVARFGGAFHRRPFWFFVPVFLAGFFPWSLLLAGQIKYFTSIKPWARLNRDAQEGFLLLFCLWCITFFSLSSCKLPTYLLPAAPAASIITGRFLYLIMSSSFSSDWLLKVLRLFPSIVATGTTLLIGVVSAVYLLVINGSNRYWFVFGLVALSVVVAGFVLAIWICKRKRHRWIVALTASTALTIFLLHVAIPTYAEHQTILGGNFSILAKVPEFSSEIIVTAEHEWSEVPFYTKRSDIRNYSKLTEDIFENLPSRKAIVVLPSRFTKSELIDAMNNRFVLSKTFFRGDASIFQIVPVESGTDSRRVDPRNQ